MAGPQGSGGWIAHRDMSVVGKQTWPVQQWGIKGMTGPRLYFRKINLAKSKLYRGLK